MEKNNKSIWETFVPYRNFGLGPTNNLFLAYFTMYETTKVSNRYLKTKTGYSERQISRIVQKLFQWGLIEVKYLNRRQRVITHNPINIESLLKDIDLYFSNLKMRSSESLTDNMSIKELDNMFIKIDSETNDVVSDCQGAWTGCLSETDKLTINDRTECLSHRTGCLSETDTVSNYKNPIQSFENSSYENVCENPVKKPLSTQSILDDILNSLTEN